MKAKAMKTKMLKLGSTMLVVEFNAAVTNVKRDATTAIRAKLHAAVAAVFRWALSIPAVQQEIADAIIEDNSKELAEAVAEELTITVNRRR